MIVIKSGKNFAKVYADKAFDKWGTPTDADIRIVENWCDIKIPDTAEMIDSELPYECDFTDYCNMIENTLWIFNNEPIKIKEEAFMTGAGVNWMFQKGKTNIFDISNTQIAFVNALLSSWNGENYGEFVYNFIKKHKVIHFHVNLNETQNSNKELFANKSNFINSINENFTMLKNKYASDWQWNPNNTTAQVGNLLEQLAHNYMGKFLLSNIMNFKYYFAKCYIKDIHTLLSPSTKAFIQKTVKNPEKIACEKIELGVPVEEVYEEINKIKKYLRPHRGDSGLGWRAFCIHGQSYSRTKEESYYNDFLGYKWTPEAIENMPITIKWLKSLGYKNFKRVRVMCLEPKGFINLHKDQDHSELGAVNIAINNPSECKFYLQNHGVLEFKPGVAFKLDLVNYHTVINNSDVPRYHIIIHGDK